MSSAADTAPPPTIKVLTPGYRNYAIGLLFVVYVFNFLDRQIVTILAEPIKQELGIADWQLGLMTGTAFAIFYCTLGIPIARLAERRNRPWIIGLSLAAWSGFTALCGLAQNFWQLVLARIGVGVGEAGCTPPAHSLIADYTPKEKLASAMAFYALGNPIGALIGVVAGGLIADAFGWRNAFLLVGLPGIAMAILVILTLVEPRIKAAAHEAKAAATPQTSFADVIRILLKKRTFWLLSAAVSVIAFVGYGHAPFTASFFLRVHGDQIAEVAARFGLGPLGFLGLALGLVSGLSAALGVFIGGLLADRFGSRDLRAYVSIPAVAILATIPIYCTAILWPTFAPAIALLAVNAVLASLWHGPTYATVQSIVPPHMRATTASIFLFIVNLVGLGIGPVGVGLLSDVLSVQFGLGEAEGVRWALIASQILIVPAFISLWMVRRSIREEFES